MAADLINSEATCADVLCMQLREIRGLLAAQDPERAKDSNFILLATALDLWREHLVSRQRPVNTIFSVLEKQI